MKMTNKSAYAEQQKKLKAKVKRLQKQGFFFTDGDLKELEITTTPKRVTTNRLRKIQNISLKDIKSKAKIVDEDTGEVFQSTKAFEYSKTIRTKKEQVASKRLPSFSSIALDTLYEQIQQFGFKPGAAYMKKFLDTAAEKLGKDKVVKHVLKAIENGDEITVEMLYNTELASEWCLNIVDSIEDNIKYSKNKKKSREELESLMEEMESGWDAIDEGDFW